MVELRLITDYGCCGEETSRRIGEEKRKRESKDEAEVLAASSKLTAPDPKRPPGNVPILTIGSLDITTEENRF